MKIALLTYEYPPDTAYGGIATYMYQIAKMLTQRGHYVEVFACSPHRSGTYIEEGIKINRVVGENRSDRKDFSRQIGAIFAKRHAEVEFDVLEGAEADAHTRASVELIPEIPLVIKLHTPGFMCDQLGYIKPSLEMKMRRFFGAIRLFQKPEPFAEYYYDREIDIERLHTLEADEITTPSVALGNILVDEWQLPREKLFHIPNPYIPSEGLINIPIKTQTNIVSFLGRLEMRKGITDLAEAIPLILKQSPDTKFLFVGESCPSPDFKLYMHQYIERRLIRYKKSLEFTGRISLSDVPTMLSKTDICVFPSRWENFPNVCLEAMAAGRGVIGSSAGGMFDMLDGGNAGVLVPPYSPQKITEAVIKLLNNPTLRMELGQIARDRVLREYNLERIGALQEASYERAIMRRKTLGKRVVNRELQPN